MDHAETPDSTGAESDRTLPPVFDPDPLLMDHMEGNKRAIRRYRENVRMSHARAVAAREAATAD